MYWLALVLGLATGSLLVWRGVIRERRRTIAVGVLIALVVPDPSPARGE